MIDDSVNIYLNNSCIILKKNSNILEFETVEEARNINRFVIEMYMSFSVYLCIRLFLLCEVNDDEYKLNLFVQFGDKICFFFSFTEMYEIREGEQKKQKSKEDEV